MCSGVAKGSFHFGGLGVDLFSLDAAAFVFATVGNRPQPASLWRSYMAMPIAIAAKVVTFDHFWRFQTSCTVVSCGRCGALWHSNMFVSKVVLCDRRNTFARFSGDDVRFRCRRSTLETSIFILRVRAASSGENVQLAWQVWDIVSGRRSIWSRSVACRMSFCVAGAVFGTLSWLQLPLSALAWPCKARCCLCLSWEFAWQAQYLVMFQVATLDSTPSTLPTLSIITLNISHSTPHSTLHKSHSTLYTAQLTFHIRNPHSTIYTSQSALYTPHFTLYTPHSTGYISHSTLCTSDLTLYTVHFTLHTTLYTLHFTLHTLHCTLSTPHSRLWTLYFTHFTLHLRLDTANFTLHTLHYTLHTLRTLRFTL